MNKISIQTNLKPPSCASSWPALQTLMISDLIAYVPDWQFIRIA